MKRILLTLWILAGLAGPVLAWNSVGHFTVVKVAYDQLGDGEKTKLFNILKHHPHYDRFLNFGRPADISEVEWVLLRASVWPDWVRPRPKENRGSDVTRYHRGEDHYTNIPIINPKDQDYFEGKVLVSPDLANIVSALKQRCNDLHTRTSVFEDQAIALCWIFHLVGDIHQPMHNVAFFSQSKAFEKGDQGGNKFGIRVNGKGWKLHAYWDELLGEDLNYADDTSDRQVRIYKAAVNAAEKLRGRKLEPIDQERLEKNLTFESWSKESFELAKTVAYQKADGTGLIEGIEVPFIGRIPDSAPEVGKEYDRKAHDTAEIRVKLAGSRLADRLRMIMPK